MNVLTVLIAAPELLPTLKKTAAGDGEVLAFSDADALRALETISRRHPGVVAVEAAFAATPRGTALINRIKADPTLADSEVRIVSPDTGASRVVPRSAPTAPGTAASTGTAEPAPAPLLDQRGTRRAPRSRIESNLEVVADGNTATLVDLSQIGAQVVSTVILKPNQRLRMTLSDEEVTIRVNAVVAWAAFEIPPGVGPRYRAGIEFVDPDTAAIDAFRERHRLRS